MFLLPIYSYSNTNNFPANNLRPQLSILIRIVSLDYKLQMRSFQSLMDKKVESFFKYRFSLKSSPPSFWLSWKMNS